MNENNNPTPRLDDGLRAELAGVLIRGFLSQMAGYDVDDDDVVVDVDPEPIRAVALSCIDSAGSSARPPMKAKNASP